MVGRGRETWGVGWGGGDLRWLAERAARSFLRSASPSSSVLSTLSLHARTHPRRPAKYRLRTEHAQIPLLADFPDSTPLSVLSPDGVELRAVTANLDAPGPVVVFLHGFPQTARCWRDAFARARRTHAVCAVDMRGAGESGKPDAAPKLGNYRMRRLVDDVIAVVRATGKTECVLAAHDWGGAVAWNLAAIAEAQWEAYERDVHRIYARKRHGNGKADDRDVEDASSDDQDLAARAFGASLDDLERGLARSSASAGRPWALGAPALSSWPTEAYARSPDSIENNRRISGDNSGPSSHPIAHDGDRVGSEDAASRRGSDGAESVAPRAPSGAGPPRGAASVVVDLSPASPSPIAPPSSPQDGAAVAPPDANVAGPLPTPPPVYVSGLVVASSPHPRAYADPRCFDGAQARRSWYFALFANASLAEAYLVNEDYANTKALFESESWGPKRLGTFLYRDVDHYVAAIEQPGSLRGTLAYYAQALQPSGDEADDLPLALVMERTLQAPTVVLHGDADAAFGATMFAHMEDYAPNAEIREVRDCSHWLPEDRPEEFWEALQDVLQGASAVAAGAGPPAAAGPAAQKARAPRAADENAPGGKKKTPIFPPSPETHVSTSSRLTSAASHVSRAAPARTPSAGNRPGTGSRRAARVAPLGGEGGEGGASSGARHGHHGDPALDALDGSQVGSAAGGDEGGRRMGGGRPR